MMKLISFEDIKLFNLYSSKDDTSLLIEEAKSGNLVQIARKNYDPKGFIVDLAIKWEKPNIIVSRTVGLWVTIAKLDTKDYSKEEIIERIDRWRACDYPEWLKEGILNKRMGAQRI